MAAAFDVNLSAEAITIYSRKGGDMTQRFRRLKDRLAAIPVESAIMDCEIVACDESGQPDFRSLMRNAKDCDLCLWGFDLLAIDGMPVLDKPLFQRRTALNELLIETDEQGLQFSAAFYDPVKLLSAAERMGLEGIVSKRRASVYRSGPTAWHEANRDRWELFERRR